MANHVKENFNSIRHVAYQIIAQLPENEREAMRILEYARQILLHPIEERTNEPISMKLVERVAD